MEQPSNREWIESYEQFNQQQRGISVMDMNKYASSGGDDLKAKDFIGKHLKVVISAVDTRDYPATDTQPADTKAVLSFEGKEKTLVLNATNTKALISGYGRESEEWIGKGVGLTVADYTDKGYGHGWVVKALDAPEPEFEDDIPF